jgi:hypothetical protein
MQMAWVDDQDYDRIMAQGCWNANWTPDTKSYVAKRTGIGYMHRFILGVTDPEVRVDHRNHDTLDNRKENLRLSDASSNGGNQRKRSDNSSGFKGVGWHKAAKSWACQIQLRGNKST